MSDPNATSNTNAASSKPVKTQEEKDKEYFDPDNLIVNLGGKQVPFNQINKPHTVVLDERHKPKVDPNTFPDIEPEAKAREAKLEENRAQASQKKNE